MVQELDEVRRKLGIVAPPGALTFSLPLVLAASNVSMPAASAIQDGYLTAVSFAAFSAKESVLTFNLPLSRTANAVSIANAVADGATKGAAAFTASDFDATSGVISIDYTNGQAASAANKGFLTSADWSTFNAKVSASRSIATTSPLTGGGDLSADRTFAIPAATGSVNGYLSSTDWTTFNAKESALTFTAPIVRTVNTVAPDFTVSWVWTALNISATPTDRIQLSNTQAAISGTQQYSPALRFTGQGFKTDATTGSKATDFRIYNQPVQATGNPTANLLIDFSVDGGAFATKYTFNSAGTLTAVQNLICGTSGIIAGGAGVGLAATLPLYWVSSANAVLGTTDTKLVRDGAAGVIATHNGTTNAGAHRIYNTLTSATSFERLDLQWASNVAQLWTEKGSGGGTARDLVLGADATEILRFQTGSKLGFFAIATPVAQQVLGGAVTNNVTSGGTTRTIANYTDLTTYANDAAAIRNNFYQLAATQLSVVAALRNYGLLT